LTFRESIKILIIINIIKKSIGKIVQIPYQLKNKYMDNFIFIHINKTGGSSIEKALKLPSEHKTAVEKIEEIGIASWERKFTFTVIRNPWDKVVSHYHYRVQTNQTSLGIRPINFNQWVWYTYENKDPIYYDFPKMFMPQVDWITNNDEKILVNKIIHFENLEDEFKAVARRLGKHVNLPHIKASNRGNYREYYDDKTIKVIEKWFSKDIENFGYSY
jgi:hypothetical protein